MDEQFGAGVYATPAPVGDDDAAASYQVIEDKRRQAQEEEEWLNLMGLGADTAPAGGASPVAGVSGQPGPQGQPAAQPEGEGGVWNTVKAIGADIGEGIAEAPAQIVGGIGDAAVEASNAIKSLTGIGGFRIGYDDDGNFGVDYQNYEEFNKAGGSILEQALPDDADSGTGKFVRSTAQFLTGFIPAAKAAKAMGVANTALRGLTAGAVADGVVMDPNGDRLSTFLNEVPALEPFVSDYLAASGSENESEWEGRLKNVVEGAGIGLAAEGVGALFKAFKYYKVQQQGAPGFAPGAAAVNDQVAKDMLQQAAREELVEDVPDDALRGLGNPEGPRFIEAAEGEDVTTAFKRVADAEARAAKSIETQDALGKVNAIRERIAAKVSPEAAAAGRDPLDDLIDTLRSGAKTPLEARRPVAGIVKTLGGIDPSGGLAAELKARGITARTHPGLFRKGGRGNLDNVRVEEQPIFAMRGLDDGNGYVPEQAWIDALEDEVKGNPWRSAEEQAKFDDLIAPAQELEAELHRLGLDPETMSNATIKTRMQEIADEDAMMNRPSAPPDAEPITLDDANAIDAPDRVRAEAMAEAPKGKVYINHARIQSAEDVKAVLQELADLDQTAIKDKTRGVVTNAQTIKESSQEYKDLDDLIGRPPGPMTAAQATAARQLLTSSGEQIVQLAKRAQAPDASKADIFNFRRAMSVHYAIQSEVIAARTETARALQAWSIPVGATKARSQAISELIAQGGGAGDLQQLARAVASVGDNPAAVNAMARQLGKGQFGKALYQVWINGLLSSPKTHVVNILSNSMVAAYSIPERYLAAGISKAFYDGSIETGEAAAQSFGMVKGIRDGFRLVWHGNKAGEQAGLGDLFDQFTKTEGRPSDISGAAFGFGPESAFGRGLDYLGKAVNVPGSLLEVEDKFFKSVGYRMELNALAYRQAAQEGLEGEAAARRIADILADPPPNLQADALDVAAVNTFTNPLGKMGQSFTQMVNRVPGARLVVPFIKTPTNIMKFTFSRTPLAYMSGAIRADIKAGGARAAQAHARVALGSMIMLSVADMATEGAISGRGPEDPKLRSAKMAEGWQPYSVKIGGRWYQYSRTDPIGMIMGLGADTAELITNADDEDRDMMALAGVVALANNLASKTYLSGIYDFIAAVDPNNPTSDPSKYLQDFAGGLVPYSSFLRQTTNAMDPVMRDTRTVVYGEDGKVDEVATWFESLHNKIRSQIPGMGKDIPPRRDLFGEPITRASELGWAYDMLSPIASKVDDPDPVVKAIVDNKVKISAVPRTIHGVKLNNEEYSEFQRLAGQPLKEYLDKLVSTEGFKRMSDGPDGMKAELIRDAVHNFRESARAQMLASNPRLQRISFMKRAADAQKLLGGGQ